MVSVNGFFASAGENSLTKVRFAPFMLTKLSPACSPASSAGVTGIISFTTNGVLKLAQLYKDVISSSIKFSEILTFTVSVPLKTLTSFALRTSLIVSSLRDSKLMPSA